MCIHPLAMADGLSAVPDYLPGRHRGERPRSWSSSPLLIVIPALDRHPRESGDRSEEHTSELQSLMRISYAVFCLKKKKNQTYNTYHTTPTTVELHKQNNTTE